MLLCHVYKIGHLDAHSPIRRSPGRWQALFSMPRDEESQLLMGFLRKRKPSSQLVGNCWCVLEGRERMQCLNFPAAGILNSSASVVPARGSSGPCLAAAPLHFDLRHPCCSVLLPPHLSPSLFSANFPLPLRTDCSLLYHILLVCCFTFIYLFGIFIFQIASQY